MARSFRSLIPVLLLLALASCKPAGAAPKSLVLNDFEFAPDPALRNAQFDPKEALKKPLYPIHDFDLHTEGYASLEAATLEQARAANDKPLYKFIRGGLAGDKPGKTALKVRFSVPADYRSAASAPARAWECGFKVSIETLSRLKATDWTAFRYLDVRAYNPYAEPLTVCVRVTDTSTSLTSSAAVLPPGESVVELNLQQLREARLNAGDIRSLTVYMDTVRRSKDLSLYFDDLALYTDTRELRVKAAAAEGAEEGAEEEEWEAEEEEGTVREVSVVPGRALAAPTAQPTPAEAETDETPAQP